MANCAGLLGRVTFVRTLDLIVTVVVVAGGFVLSDRTTRAADIASIVVDYDAIVDRRADTHAQRPLGAVLEDAAQVRNQQTRREVLAIVEPLLEPCAVVLEDALVTADSARQHDGL